MDGQTDTIKSKKHPYAFWIKQKKSLGNMYKHKYNYK